MGQTSKAELIATLSVELNLPVREVTQIIDTILKSLTDALVRGEGIEIRGFGSFTIREYESYVGRNPKSGEVVSVKPKKLPFFKVSKQLKKAVNNTKGEK